MRLALLFVLGVSLSAEEALLPYGQIDLAAAFASGSEQPVRTATVVASTADDEPARQHPGFFRRTATDLWRVVSSPVTWDGRDWTVAGLCVAGTVATGVFLDQEFQEDSQEHRSNQTDRWSGTWGQLGTIYSLGVLGGAGLIGWISDDPRGGHILADGLEATIIASGIISPVLKFTVGRARPYEAGQDSDTFDPFGGQSSFPSGHATQAFTVASVVAFTMHDTPWIGSVAFVIAGGVGLSRINDNEHYLSDVVAGAIIGTFVGYEVVQANRERCSDDQPGLRIQPVFRSDGSGIELAWRW